MNELQHLYEKINPKDDPKVMAERIIARSKAEQVSVKTRRRLKWVPVAVSLALVLATAVPVTAGVIAGSNIFEVFKSYFNTEELNSVGMAEYHKTTEPDGKTAEQDDYRLTINGFAADKHFVCISYDIEYKNPLFFENGKLRQEFLEHSPMSFWVAAQSGSTGGGWKGRGGDTVISADGATVSYVNITGGSDDLYVPYSDQYHVKISYVCQSLNSDGSIDYNSKDILEPDDVIRVSIPAAKDITLNVNEEVTYPNGVESVLKKIELNSLSLFFYTTCNESDLPEENFGMKQVAPKLFLKDGTVFDLNLAAENNPCGGSRSSTSGMAVKEHYWYFYGTPIDPETIEAVELFGKTYTVE